MRVGPYRRLVRSLLAIAAVAVGLVGPNVLPAGARAQATTSAGTTIGPSDWPSYGHDPHHSFVGVSSLTPATAGTLKSAWFFPTGDAVTAAPTIVGNTVYVGSWDGNIYALDRASGALLWKYQLKQQNAINPSPGNTSPRDVTSDGGLVTDSAWFQPGEGGRPDLVIFGGGYTLYALVATGSNAGTLYWSHDYTGLPEQPPSPSTDSTRIFSSPVVYKNEVIVGVSSDGGAGHRGYVVAANINNGNLVWRFETDVDSTGKILNNGCDGVWSSPTLDEARGLVTFGTADCNNHGIPPYGERVIALNASRGTLSWVFTPPRLQGVAPGQDPACDFDFGTTTNLGPSSSTGAATFLGVGGKDGTYYSLDPATGNLIWQRNVVFGGSAGGFIGTTAYDGKRVYGATAIGDFGSTPCTNDPRDTPVQEPSIHALNPDGSVAWEQQNAQNFGATTLAGGMTFAGYAFGPVVEVRDAGSGSLLTSLPLQSDCFCGIAASGNGVFLGTGSPQQGTADGIYAFTPAGATPSP